MKVIGGMLLLAPLGCAGFAAAAAPVADTPTLLLERFETMNSACRGGRGDDPKRMEACAERDRLFDELTQAGWCFGREGEVEANKEWQRCDAALPPDPTGASEHNLRLVEPTAADATLEPYQYFERAQASFAAGRREDATFWLYVAQLRWRARLMANPQLDTGLRPNAFGGLDFYSDSTITVFDPSGLYSTELPQEGDVAAQCRATPTDCGLYALRGGSIFASASQIEMRAVADAFGTIEAETKPFAKQGDGLEIDGGAYSVVSAVAAGTPFEGTWRYFFAAVGTTASSSNSLSSERLLTLHRDGTFERTGWS